MPFTSASITFDAPQCIAVHIRHGDTCFTRPPCVQFEQALSAALRLKSMYNLTHVYVLTDASDFPVKQWTEHFHVRMQGIDRTQFSISEKDLEQAEHNQH